MDSRSKILTAEEARARVAALSSGLLVSGYFDPVLAAHAARLAGLCDPGRRLVVLIEDPPEPILPARARAELVAALRGVDTVVLPAPDGTAALAATVKLAAEDAERTAAFEAHVHRRQTAGG